MHIFAFFKEEYISREEDIFPETISIWPIGGILSEKWSSFANVLHLVCKVARVAYSFVYSCQIYATYRCLLSEILLQSQDVKFPLLLKLHATEHYLFQQYLTDNLKLLQTCFWIRYCVIQSSTAISHNNVTESLHPPCFLWKFFL